MQGKRFALVIGNSQYEHATPLNNPVNDAVKTAQSLTRLGFEVVVRPDCGINDFGKELRSFIRRLEDADVGLLYYSGHAVQFDGENYLIPADVRLEEIEDLKQLTLKVSEQLEQMRSAARVSLIFLDACRDDPFKLNFTGENGPTRRVFVQRRGLKELDKINLMDALVAFSAEQGHTAADGEEGGLSPFTKALLEYIEMPGLEITKMMRLVKQAVREATKGRQTPWSNDSLASEFYFIPPTTGTELPPADTSSTQPFIPRVEHQQKPTPNSVVSSRKDTTLPKKNVLGEDQPVSIFNLAAKLEIAGIKSGPLPLIFFSIIGAFALLMTSFGLGFGNITLNGKQIGQLYAPNWLIVYMVLFPLYLGLFAFLAERFKLTLTSLLKRHIILDPTGNQVTEHSLFLAWNASLKKVSVVLWCLLIFILVYESYEWTATVFLPLRHHNVGEAPVDWSTIAAASFSTPNAVLPGVPNISTAILFSLMSYLYMSIALFIYLSILVYETTFCFFISTVANPTGEYRLVLRDVTVANRFTLIGTCIYWSCILGLCAGFMMRLQAIYLNSNYKVVTDLLFGDVLTWTGYLQSIPELPSPYSSDVPSEWTGFLEIMFTLLALFAVVYLLNDAFDKARQYYLDNIDDGNWRSNMLLTHNKKEIESMRRKNFLITIFPKYFHMGVVVVGIVLSAIFIGHGIIFLGTALYAIVMFILLPAFNKRVDEPSTQTG